MKLSDIMLLFYTTGLNYADLLNVLIESKVDMEVGYEQEDNSGRRVSVLCGTQTDCYNSERQAFPLLQDGNRKRYN